MLTKISVFLSILIALQQFFWQCIKLNNRNYPWSLKYDEIVSVTIKGFSPLPKMVKKKVCCNWKCLILRVLRVFSTIFLETDNKAGHHPVTKFAGESLRFKCRNGQNSKASDYSWTAELRISRCENAEKGLPLENFRQLSAVQNHGVPKKIRNCRAVFFAWWHIACEYVIVSVLWNYIIAILIFVSCQVFCEFHRPIPILWGTMSSCGWIRSWRPRETPLQVRLLRK